MGSHCIQCFAHLEHQTHQSHLLVGGVHLCPKLADFFNSCSFLVLLAVLGTEGCWQPPCELLFSEQLSFLLLY